MSQTPGKTQGDTSEMSDDFLLELSENLGAYWEKVGYRLGMKQQDIDRAKANHQYDITKQAHSLLIQWRKQTSGKENKRALLATALGKAGCIEIAEKHDLQDLVNVDTSDSAPQLPVAAPMPPEVLKTLSDLKTLYRHKLSLVTPFPWMGKRTLCDLKKHFHELHLVTQDSKEELTRDPLEAAAASTTLRETSAPFRLCDILNPYGELPSRILVDGKAGYGKTSLCAKLAVDWSQGESYIANRFKGVFLIQARNIKDDSLETYFSKNLPKPNNAKQLLKYIGENQDKFLFIIDGLSEIVDSLPDDWIDLILGGQFISSCVLVTSRTNRWQDKLTKNLNDSQEILFQTFDQHLVNVGFTLETAFHFIESQSQTGQDTESLQEFICSHRFLRDLIHSPLICMFLCFMWKEGYYRKASREEEVLSKTRLYLDMINSLVKRFCKEAKQKEYQLIKNEFSPMVLGKLNQIYKVAYHSLLEGKAQFSLKDITRCLDDSSIDENDVMFSFGILVKEMEFDLNDCEEEAVFLFLLHKPMQEELAAEHYLKMPEEERAAAARQIAIKFRDLAYCIHDLISQRQLDPKLFSVLQGLELGFIDSGDSGDDSP